MFEIELTPKLAGRLLALSRLKGESGMSQESGMTQEAESQRIAEVVQRGHITAGELYAYISDSDWELANERELHGDERSSGLADMLHGLKFHVRGRDVPRSGYSAEFRRDLEKLRASLDEMEYQEIVRHRKLNMFVDNDDDDLTPAQMNKQIKEQVTTVFNILISVVSVVVAIWYWSRNSHVLQVHHRVLLCLFFAILVLVAEVVVYSSYLRKIDEARKHEKSKKERKRVVKKIVIN
ncbi:Vacuolar ATPase assembly integral membrane protein VPH2 [Nakaseomyces bracarensis]|uniref:Vacuolar ATPase assembly integral membrane protein VPH2 n=1 Tax=Nakaseomyces bracarensis TaxID=273131 RepID=A0ABR4NUH6_9SACH